MASRYMCIWTPWRPDTRLGGHNIQVEGQEVAVVILSGASKIDTRISIVQTHILTVALAGPMGHIRGGERQHNWPIHKRRVQVRPCGKDWFYYKAKFCKRWLENTFANRHKHIHIASCKNAVECVETCTQENVMCPHCPKQR